MNFINLTPHTITFITNDLKKVVEPSGQVARVSVKSMVYNTIDGIPCKANMYGTVEGLPEPKENTIYLVSSLVAAEVKNRTDVFIPNEPIRDDKGNIIGCASLGRV